MQRTLAYPHAATPATDPDCTCDALATPAAPPSLRIIARSRAQPPQRTYRGHLLLVDADAAARDFLGRFLQRRGYRVWGADNAAAARAMIAHRTPDLVLLDMGLPRHSSAHLLRALRQQRPTAALPIILISAATAAHDIRHGLALGADDYLTKPLELSLVEAHIEALLRRTARTYLALAEDLAAGFSAPSMNE